MVAYRAGIVTNDSGMRSVELRNLRLADVDACARRITIRKSKGDHGLFRTVILTNDALKAVLTLLDRADKLGCCRPEHYLFPFRTRNGAGYDPTKPTKGWRKAWRALTRTGLPGFRFHDLRHTFITNHAEMGTPFPVVQAQAGHLSKRMTELYTHISQRAMEDAARRYEQRKAELLAEAKKRLLEPAANENQPPIN